MNRTAWLFGVAFALTPSIAPAGPIGITNVWSSYSVTTQTLINDWTSGVKVSTTETRTISSPDPVSDSMMYTSTFGVGYTDVGATADADVFSTATSTTAWWLSGNVEVWSAEAWATSTLEFTPVEDGTGSLTIDLSAGGSAPWWSEASVMLVDSTANLVLWTYGWDWVYPSSVNSYCSVFCLSPSGPTVPTVTYNVDTLFAASHVYALSVFTHSQANRDTQIISASVTGLHIVPEPWTVVLLALGIGWISLRRTAAGFYGRSRAKCAE
jgi:hypothetical protein